MLEAVDLYQRGPTEVVIVGDRKSPELLEWIERLGLSTFRISRSSSPIRQARPHPGSPGAGARDKRQIDGQVTAYVCRERTCTPPITSSRTQKELAD